MGDWGWRVPGNARSEWKCGAESEEGGWVGGEASAIGVSSFWVTEDFVYEFREGIDASDADYESHFLHTFLGMLLHICKITHVRRRIGERY